MRGKTYRQLSSTSSLALLQNSESNFTGQSWLRHYQPTLNTSSMQQALTSFSAFTHQSLNITQPAFQSFFGLLWVSSTHAHQVALPWFVRLSGLLYSCMSFHIHWRTALPTRRHMQNTWTDLFGIIESYSHQTCCFNLFNRNCTVPQPTFAHQLEKMLIRFLLVLSPVAEVLSCHSSNRNSFFIHTASRPRRVYVLKFVYLYV